MKRLIYTVMIAAGMLLASCTDRQSDLDPDSIYGSTSTKVENDFDRWLKKNFTDPYNIEFKYRWEDKESDMDYNLSPADYDKSVALAKLVKYLWLDAYVEVAGNDFICKYSPKQFFLVGSPAYQPSSGSMVLGTAEGGMKIVLYNVNNIDVDKLDIETLNYYYFKTMHHEFSHILHQTKNYSTDFNNITNSSYQSGSWVNVTDAEAHNMGFVTPYASSEPREDFVETIAVYVTHDADYWYSEYEDTDNISEEGAGYIAEKLQFVRDYLKTSWGIDLDELRSVVQRRSADVKSLDLKSLD